MSTDTKKRNARQYKWQVENRERMTVLFNKGTREKVKAAADRSGVSSSVWIETAINEKLARDDGRPDQPGAACFGVRMDHPRRGSSRGF